MRDTLDPLPPDLTFELLPVSQEALLFSFKVKKDAMEEHVAARWGWDEEYQFRAHRKRFETKPLFAIVKGTERVGTLSWAVESDHIRFGEFYLLGKHRGMGLGTRILVHALAEADAMALPVRLEYLRWNPVGSLYRRYGFADVYATETHFHLERQAPPP